MDKVDFSDRAGLIREIESNLWETWSTYGCGPGCSLHAQGDMLWFETPIPIIPYNGILKTNLQANVDQRIDEIIQHFNRKEAQFMWIVHPTSEPTDLPERLQARGLKYIEPIYGMVRSLADLPQLPRIPDDIEIRKVADDEDVNAFYQFAAWRWHIPDEYRTNYDGIISGFRFGKSSSKAHMWQAWRAGQPVSKAGMYLGIRSAGIYAVVTKPEAGRLGLACALTLTALNDARSRGFQLAVLHSTPMAERLYESLGFETIAEFQIFGSDEVYI
jgi:hypothetical protein